MFLPAIYHFKLQDILDVTAESLSAGWQRKVELARLLLSPTNLWLLDEPEINLDKNAQDCFLFCVIRIFKKCLFVGKVWQEKQHYMKYLKFWKKREF